MLTLQHETDQEKNKMELNINRLKVPLQNSLTQKMFGATMTVFFHAGRSAVYYLHSHMDHHFLSFCLMEKKTWLLIDPMYSDLFESVWSDNAQIQLREKDAKIDYDAGKR